MVKELNGDRKFEKLTRWNILEDTIISSKNKNAPYADVVNGNTDKLFLTYFTLQGKVTPFNRFVTLDTPIKLHDLSTLSRYDEETHSYLEVDTKNRKIRVWREIL